MNAYPSKKKYLAPSDSLAELSASDYQTQLEVGRRLARFLKINHSLTPPETTPSLLKETYYLPFQALLTSQAKQLETLSPNDLYGGVVPYEFLRHKTVSHPIYHPTMAHPDGWNNDLGNALKLYVIPGYSAFNTQEVLWIARGMIHDGPIRVKLAHANAAQGQYVLVNHSDIMNLLNQSSLHPFFEQGVVVEEDIQMTTTLSVGQTEINNYLISYLGEQSTTQNLNNLPTYGGSKLFVVLGGYDVLHSFLHNPIHKKTLHITQEYERLIKSYYPQIFASRRNYDVLQGTNTRGEARLGVLEQSWRMGGASMAEIIALESFAADPNLPFIHTWTQEKYYHSQKDIRDPHLAYCISEEQGGFIAKYAGLG